MVPSKAKAIEGPARIRIDPRESPAGTCAKEMGDSCRNACMAQVIGFEDTIGARTWGNTLTE